ncbi:MAG: DUF1285 domain-containing protein [Desulfatitalea sp.]|nr:DUF1285 domain-containing protein [Desulfatitalea sp.]MBI5896405.1 DUF1285 domain-containing protein [Desulfobacterales bacterium]
MSADQLLQVVIAKEDAVFWMDRFGQWYNAGGRFRHKKIIDHFNASIRKDENGYFVEQIRETVHEKVYFRYEDTPLFVVEASESDPIQLALNTGEIIFLKPDQLFVHADNLYLQRDGERIKFSDRVLMRLSTRLDYDGETYYFKSGNERHRVAQK